MKDFTTFREDLASGRPAKKPVSSNLLKNRAKENEKAMKSGFMKMPDYARKKFDEEKEEKYKPHMMYKGDKKVMAKKKGDHERLQKKGYDHDNPETKKVEEGKKGLWDNIHARRKKGLPPKKPGQEGYPKTLNIEEKKPKNCGCGQDPCITYGKGGKMEKEQVNEISDEMKMRYISKANKQISSAEKERLAGKGHAVKTDKDYDRLVSKPFKRRKGIVQAKSKLGEGAMKRMATDKEESKRLSASKGTFPGNDMATFKKKTKPTVTIDKPDRLVSLKVSKEENIFEISDALKKRYMAKAGKEVSDKEHMKDYLQRQMDRSNKKTPGTFSGMNKKFVDDKYDKETLKRRKGMAQARSKLTRESYEKGRGPTGIAYAIPAGHPDAENPKTRKKYPERQTPEYKAKWKSKSKKVFGEEKQKGIDGKVCWKGYKRMGTKKKGGKTVDNCVKVEDFVLDAFYDYYLAELSPQTIKSYQKKAGAQYRDLKKTTPSRQSIVTGYHKGYISDKEYDQQHAARDKLNKRGKGLAMSKGKGVAKEEKMIGSEYSSYMKGVKSTNRDVRSAVSHTLDQKKSPLTKKHAKHPEVKKAQKYMTQEQMQLMTNLDMDESISALVKRGVGKVKQAMSDAGQAYRDNDAKQKKAGKGKYYNPMSGDNIAKRYPGRLELKKG